ncbi:MAG: DinB family protein [Planctomycetaceae bacterium]|nr:DinB family protein [Planctomycetaceae bacterium]
MSTLHSTIAAIGFNRVRTLATLDRALQEKEPQRVLGWRPGPGRAHVAWQLTHLAITEELFATERLVPGSKPAWPDLVPRFRGGSTPDDEIPSGETIRRLLSESREHLLATLARFGDKDLGTIPEALKERKLMLVDVLHILSWHEAHHQGQAHITLNLYKAAHA